MTETLRFPRFPFAVAAALLVVGLAGCGGGEKPAEGKAAPVSTATETPPTPARTEKDAAAPSTATPAGQSADSTEKHGGGHAPPRDYTALLFVFMLATFIGLGVILRVSRLLHTPLMSLTNAISAIAVVGSIMVTGNPNPDLPTGIRILGAIALFASTTNIVSGFLITDRMLKMFRSPGDGGKR